MLLVAAYVLVFAAQTLLTRQVFTRRFPGGNDFYPRWAGGCRLFWQGADPYSEETTDAIQRGVYGRLARADEDQVAFAYPLYVLLFIWPTCLLRDFSTVQAAWMTASLHLLLAGTFLTKRVAPWRAGGTLWLATLAWAAFVYPNARAILLGQLSIVVFFALAACLWGLTNGRPWLAGFALAATTIKPQMSLLIVPWILLWSWTRGRTRVVLGFAGAMLSFFAGAWLFQPDWIAGFLDQLRRYPSYTELGSGIWIMTTYYLDAPRIVEYLLTGVALAYLGWHWLRSRGAGEIEMLWVASLTLVLTHFVSPRTATTHFAIFLLPMFMIFEWWRRDSGTRKGTIWVGLTLGLVLIGSWALFLLTVEGDQESAMNYLPIPLTLLVVLIGRRERILSARAEPT